MTRVALFAFLAFAAGCVPGTSGRAMEMGSDCRHGSAQPITADEALSALRVHGFTVYREEESLFCGGDNSAEDVIANVLQSGPPENFTDPGEITGREGTLYCGLHARPFPNAELHADSDAPAASPIFSGRKAESPSAASNARSIRRGTRPRLRLRAFARRSSCWSATSERVGPARWPACCSGRTHLRKVRRKA
jgi:hypothetical protein